MVDLSLPSLVPNFINGQEAGARSGERFEKRSPADGRVLAEVARSRAEDVHAAVAAARCAQPAWGQATVVSRGDQIRAIALGLREQQEEVARLVARETGKSPKDARGETGGAIELGMFVAGEGQRLYGRTTTSAVPNKPATTVRQPCGVAALIIAANTPIANVAWKVFPALICGNAAVLKAAEDTPLSALGSPASRRRGRPSARRAQRGAGLGEEADAAWSNPRGRRDQLHRLDRGREVDRRDCGEAPAKVSLELGGKNPLVVCDDADLDARR